MRRRFSRPWALLGLAGTLCACECGTPATGPDLPRAQVTFITAAAEIPVQVEVAANAPARARGLMHRRRLAPYAGMIFVFDTPAPQSFWMKNTLLSLDMIFLDSERQIVGVVADTEPLSLEARGVASPALYVVEVNGGFAARHGIGVGSEVVFAGAALAPRPTSRP